MLEDMNTIVIISAFGRGHWLAVELQRSGLSVCLVDVTEKMGSSVPEDAEGPFGFFYSEKKKESQLERFLEGDPPQTLPGGFTVWLSDGPLEMKSSLTLHRLDQLQVAPEVRTAILAGEADSFKKIQNLPFSKTWLAQIGASLAANVYFPHGELLNSKLPLSLFSNYMTIMPTRQGDQKSLDWCRRQGVKVIEKAEVIDFSFFDRKLVRGIEIRHDRSDLSRLIEGERFVWCLTSEESEMLGVKIQDHLYPEGKLEPEWIWSRFRIKLLPCLEREQLPAHFLMLQDLDRPWTHENFTLVIRTGSPDFFDCWMRISNVQRFNKEHLEFRGQRLIEILKSRLELSDPQIGEYPIGYEHTYNQVGPARHPIYNLSKKTRHKVGGFQNIYFDSPEQWDCLGWEGAFAHQNGIITQINHWWEAKQAQLRKQKKNQGMNEVNSD